MCDTAPRRRSALCRCSLTCAVLFTVNTAEIQAIARPWTPLATADSQVAEASESGRRDETSVTNLEPRPPYAATVYAGKSIGNRLTTFLATPWESRFENEYVVSVSLSARLFELTDRLSLEVEANISRRFGNAELWEFAVPLFLRWDDFPWNDAIYTTVGLSLIGPSYATEISKTERRKSHNDRGSHWLNFFAPEITLSPPDNRNFEFVARVHHRSGIFGLINGVSGGSSYGSLGLRYRF